MTSTQIPNIPWLQFGRTMKLTFASRAHLVRTDFRLAWWLHVSLVPFGKFAWLYLPRRRNG